MAFASLVASSEAHAPESAFTYLELGCGQGDTCLTVGAAHPNARVIGVDFHPDHVWIAQRRAAEMGLTNVTFVERAFGDLDLDVQAEFVAIHGVISWVTPQVEQDIVRVLRRNTAPGALVYVSYNALPGRAAAAGLQQLVMEVQGRYAGHPMERLSKAIEFVQQLRKEGGYFENHPLVGRYLDTLSSRSLEYLSHELLHENWRPQSFRQVQRLLEDARLSWVGGAEVLNNVPSLALPSRVNPFLEGIEDRTLRETVKDTLVDTSFRRDLFGRGRMPLSTRERRLGLLRWRYTLAKTREKCTLDVRVPAGEVHLHRLPYVPILDALQAGALDGRELVAQTGLDEENVQIGLVVLSAVGHIVPVLGTAGEEERIRSCDEVNRRALVQGGESVRLISPLTGLQHRLSRFEALLARALIEGSTDASGYVFDALEAAGTPLLADEAPAPRDLALPELRRLEARFRAESWQILRAHRALPPRV